MQGLWLSGRGRLFHLSASFYLSPMKKMQGFLIQFNETTAMAQCREFPHRATPTRHRLLQWKKMSCVYFFCGTMQCHPPTHCLPHHHWDRIKLLSYSQVQRRMDYCVVLGHLRSLLTRLSGLFFDFYLHIVANWTNATPCLYLLWGNSFLILILLLRDFFPDITAGLQCIPAETHTEMLVADIS